MRQKGDSDIQPFSFLTKEKLENRVDCFIAATNPETHAVIQANLHRSPLYGGMIEGVGPRYCPSIEDKVVRFSEKDHHQIFVEPCGEDTEEMYLQGMSSSLPEDVQNEMYRTIVGFEHLEIMRPAYAIEYDCIDPTALTASLETKAVKGLFGAGQFNGTSGYEEAAAQGLVAGVNAARKAQGKDPVTLARQESYIGTLIDDLVTKGVMDPYRMMTSRSEYRLYLRQDNADERLTPTGRAWGLVTDERWTDFEARSGVKRAEIERLKTTTVRPADANPVLEEKGEPVLTSGALAAELLRRPALHYADVARMIGENPDVTSFIGYCIEVEVKYEGYVRRQRSQIHAWSVRKRRPSRRISTTRRSRGCRSKRARSWRRSGRAASGRRRAFRACRRRTRRALPSRSPHTGGNKHDRHQPTDRKGRAVRHRRRARRGCARPVRRTARRVQQKGEPHGHHRAGGHRGPPFHRQPAACGAAGEVRGRVVDVGTGAGFPGIVLKLFRPEIELTLMEPTGKRVDFLKYACAELGIEAEFAKERAEEAARKRWRETFDTAVARAVADLPVLAEYCLPLVKVGGMFVAMKGSSAQDEAARGAGAVKKLGGEVAGTRAFTLPDSSARELIFCTKISHTPPAYPRNGGKIAKAPLK